MPIIPFPNCIFYLSCIGKEHEQIYLCTLADNYEEILTKFIVENPQYEITEQMKTLAIKETKRKQEYYLERANEKSKFFVNEMKFFITYEPINENTTYYNNYADQTNGFSFDCILQPV